jgi:hypothetical protein
VGGAVILVVWAGWHALWLYPAALIGVSIAGEALLWDVPVGAYVGEWGPTTLVSVAALLALGGILPVFLLALLRAVVTY